MHGDLQLGIGQVEYGPEVLESWTCELPRQLSQRASEVGVLRLEGPTHRKGFGLGGL